MFIYIMYNINSMHCYVFIYARTHFMRRKNAMKPQTNHKRVAPIQSVALIDVER